MTIILERGNLLTRVRTAAPKEMDWLLDYLTFPDASARYRQGGPKEVRMLERNGCFPSGLLPLVVGAAGREGFEVLSQDLRNLAPREEKPDLAWLYDYQREAVEAVLAAGHGLIDIPTGGGKGEIVVALARAVRVPWLFVVHTTQLVEQTAARFDARNIEHGVGLAKAGRYAEGRREDSDSMVFATYQTIGAMLAKDTVKAKTWLAKFRAVVADEAHTCAAQSFLAIMMQLKNAAYRVGLSGTPLQRGDRRSVYTIACLGPVVFKVPATKLIELGKIARPTINMVKCKQVVRNWSSYASMYSARVSQSDQRNALAVRIAAKAERPLLIFVREISHGRNVEDMLLRAGLKSEFVCGDHSVEWRERRIKDLVAGRLDVLVASVVFQAGIDIPELLSAINLTGMRSTIATLQFLGRAMRATDGTGKVTKSSFTYWDIWDNDHVRREDDWLRDAAADRRRAYQKAGHQVEIVEPDAL